LKIAVIYGATAGIGGLGLQAATALSGLAEGDASIHAFGPGYASDWPLSQGTPSVNWNRSPELVPQWAGRYTWLRWYQGQYQLLNDVRLGRWAASQIERLHPESVYTFTQVGLEALRWAKRAGVPTALDNPNGHIRVSREVGINESRRWCGKEYLLHPSAAMVERIEEEYELADRIRVSSEWSKSSMVAYGVPPDKITVIPQTINLTRFAPGPVRPTQTGPLRICFVGIVGLHKGFVYLLKAMKSIGTERASVAFVGATGDRCSRSVFEREQSGLAVTCAPGDPVATYQQSEIFVLPSLQDGFGFVVAEAMACGLPVIVTDKCGAQSWVRPGETGWIVPAGDSEAIAAALEEALQRRDELSAMGMRARAEVEKLADPVCLTDLRDWFFQGN
jgi:glycosyltransferase involved in cell wall biosynthesis